MRRPIRIALMLMAALVAGRTATAQTAGLADDAGAGLISAGAYVGLEFDNPDNALVLGGDGRIKFSTANLEVNPRYTYRPFDGGSMQQIDVNFITNHRLNNPGRFRPYTGIGVGVHRLSVDDAGSATDIGLNLVSGVRLAMRPGAAYEPFLQAQYTIMKEPANSFTLVVGTSFSFR